MRRFPPPWTVERLPGGFKVIDANGQSLAYFYARENDHDDRGAEEDQDECGAKQDEVKTAPKITGSIHTHFWKVIRLKNDYTE